MNTEAETSSALAADDSVAKKAHFTIKEAYVGSARVFRHQDSSEYGGSYKAAENPSPSAKKQVAIKAGSNVFREHVPEDDTETTVRVVMRETTRRTGKETFEATVRREHTSPKDVKNKDGTMFTVKFKYHAVLN